MDGDARISVAAIAAAEPDGQAIPAAGSLARRLAVGLCRAGLRLIAVAACIALLGWSCMEGTRSRNRTTIHRRSVPQAPACIVAGFLSVTVLAGVRLGSRALRRGLTCRPISVVGLCTVLLALQGFETFSHAYRRPLWSVAERILPRSETSPQELHAVASAVRWLQDLGIDYEGDLAARIALLAAASLAISLLWAVGALEVALGSALFWIWAFAYLLLDGYQPWHVWGWDFWGQSWRRWAC